MSYCVYIHESVLSISTNMKKFAIVFHYEVAEVSDQTNKRNYTGTF